MNAIIGIDFGTVFTKVAFLNLSSEVYEEPILLPFSEEMPYVPSSVRADLDGELQASSEGLRSFYKDPGTYLSYLKLHLGVDKKFRLAGKEYTNIECVSAIFTSVKQLAEARADRISGWSLVIPDYFEPDHLRDILHAANQSGIQVDLLVHEHIAGSAGVYGEDVPGRIYLNFGAGNSSVVYFPSSSKDTAWKRHSTKLNGIELINAVMHKLRSEIIRQSRIDPFEYADTEQLIFNASVSIIHDLTTNKQASISLDIRGSESVICFGRDDMEKIAAESGYFDFFDSALQELSNAQKISGDPLDVITSGSFANALPSINELLCKRLSSKHRVVNSSTGSAALSSAVILAGVLMEGDSFLKKLGVVCAFCGHCEPRSKSTPCTHCMTTNGVHIIDSFSAIMDNATTGSVCSEIREHPYIRLMEGGDEIDRRLILEDSFRIGRDPRSSWVIDDPRVSNAHCLVYKKSDKLYLRDLGSRNGTYIDGERIEEVALKGGELFKFGKRGPVFQVVAG